MLTIAGGIVLGFIGIILLVVVATVVVNGVGLPKLRFNTPVQFAVLVAFLWLVCSVQEEACEADVLFWIGLFVLWKIAVFLNSSFAAENSKQKP